MLFNGLQLYEFDSSMLDSYISVTNQGLKGYLSECWIDVYE